MTRSDVRDPFTIRITVRMRCALNILGTNWTQINLRNLRNRHFDIIGSHSSVTWSGGHATGDRRGV